MLTWQARQLMRHSDGRTKHPDVVQECQAGERGVAGHICADKEPGAVVGGIAAQRQTVQGKVVVVDEDATCASRAWCGQAPSAMLASVGARAPPRPSCELPARA